MVLYFRYRSGLDSKWEHVQQPAELDWTPCNFGQERPWFLCPGIGCGRRVAVLRPAGKYLLCRRCYGLSYQSQRDLKMYRALGRAPYCPRATGANLAVTDTAQYINAHELR